MDHGVSPRIKPWDGNTVMCPDAQKKVSALKINGKEEITLSRKENTVIASKFTGTLNFTQTNIASFKLLCRAGAISSWTSLETDFGIQLGQIIFHLFNPRTD